MAAVTPPTDPTIRRGAQVARARRLHGDRHGTRRSRDIPPGCRARRARRTMDRWSAGGDYMVAWRSRHYARHVVITVGGEVIKPSSYVLGEFWSSAMSRTARERNRAAKRQRRCARLRRFRQRVISRIAMRV